MASVVRRINFDGMKLVQFSPMCPSYVLYYLVPSLRSRRPGPTLEDIANHLMIQVLHSSSSLTDPSYQAGSDENDLLGHSRCKVLAMYVFMDQIRVHYTGKVIGVIHEIMIPIEPDNAVCGTTILEAIQLRKPSPFPSFAVVGRAPRRTTGTLPTSKN